jgi:hypothetical protein
MFAMKRLVKTIDTFMVAPPKNKCNINPDYKNITYKKSLEGETTITLSM